MDIFLSTITLLWLIISVFIKAILYILYFVPLVMARIIQFFDLWPTLWPFSPLM